LAHLAREATNAIGCVKVGAEAEVAFSERRLAEHLRHSKFFAYATLRIYAQKCTQKLFL
jgi:hypothetical protein